MNSQLTQTVDNGHRNSSLLGAFALVLALAFGVGTSATSTAASAGQQLVPVDLGLPLCAESETSSDIAVPVASAAIAAVAGAPQSPQSRRLSRVITATPVVFLARAPPV